MGCVCGSTKQKVAVVEGVNCLSEIEEYYFDGVSEFHVFGTCLTPQRTNFVLESSWHEVDAAHVPSAVRACSTCEWGARWVAEWQVSGWKPYKSSRRQGTRRCWRRRAVKGADHRQPAFRKVTLFQPQQDNHAARTMRIRGSDRVSPLEAEKKRSRRLTGAGILHKLLVLVTRG